MGSQLGVVSNTKSDNDPECDRSRDYHAVRKLVSRPLGSPAYNSWPKCQRTIYTAFVIAGERLASDVVRVRRWLCWIVSRGSVRCAWHFAWYGTSGGSGEFSAAKDQKSQDSLILAWGCRPKIPSLGYKVAGFAHSTVLERQVLIVIDWFDSFMQRVSSRTFSYYEY